MFLLQKNKRLTLDLKKQRYFVNSKLLQWSCFKKPLETEENNKMPDAPSDSILDLFAWPQQTP